MFGLLRIALSKRRAEKRKENKKRFSQRNEHHVMIFVDEKRLRRKPLICHGLIHRKHEERQGRAQLISLYVSRLSCMQMPM